MRAGKLFSKRTPYLIWTVISAILLVCTRYVDPYVFGFTAFGTAGLSGLFLLASIFLGIRQIGWAMLGALPTIVAFALLSTFKWA